MSPLSGNLPAAARGGLPSIKEKMDQMDLEKKGQKPTFPGGRLSFYSVGPPSLVKQLVTSAFVIHGESVTETVFQEPEPCVCLQHSAVPIILQK